MSRQIVIACSIACALAISAAHAQQSASPTLGPPTYPIAADVFSTRERTIAPAPKPSAPMQLHEISKYRGNGYGVWSFAGPLNSVVRTDLLGPNFERSLVTRKKRLLNFFSISDVHITDKESPSQLIYLARLFPSAPVSASLFSGVMLYTTHVLDAAVQTVNTLHRATPFDFGISLGDVANSTQFNELRWYIDVLDGKWIVPSSGAHLGADTIDYQKPYQAAGLDPSIPWYQALGNHDHFWIGSIPVDFSKRADLRQSYVSDEIFAAGAVLQDPRKIADRDYYMGVVDGATPFGEIRGAGPVQNFAQPPKVVADPDRRSLRSDEWMKEFFASSSKPAGHGFSPADAAKGFACYSFAPKAGLPLKVIVLDDTQIENDGSTDIHGHGFLDAARWAWLKKELADGDAVGQLMMIAAHVPIGVEKTAPNSEMGWWTDPQNAVTLETLVAELQSHPNFILWLSGHRHFNVVKAFQSPDPTRAPERGFWQVETPSLRDFPQQFRTFALYLNSDDTLSIVTTDVDPAVADNSPAATSRTYAIAAAQIVGGSANTNPTDDPSVKPMTNGSYNAELVKQLAPAMKAKLRALLPAQ